MSTNINPVSKANVSTITISRVVDGTKTQIIQTNNSARLQSFDLIRAGDTTKFFGFGMCQELKFSLIDSVDDNSGKLLLSKGDEVVLSVESTELDSDNQPITVTFHPFYIDEINYDENKATINVAAFDILASASLHTFSELSLTAPYTTLDLLNACCTLLGLTAKFGTNKSDNFSQEYTLGVAFNEDASIRRVLDAIAEITRSVYYIDIDEDKVQHLYMLDMSYIPNASEPIKIYNKNTFELHTSSIKKLTKVCRVTELGDNVSVGNDTGEVQYIRNNPLLEVGDDLDSMLDNLFDGGFSGDVELSELCKFTQFSADWDGNLFTKPFSKLAIYAPDKNLSDDNETYTEGTDLFYSYLVNDKISYRGFINEITSWEYTNKAEDIPSAPTSIGDRINQTYARVDKINKEISLVNGEVEKLDTKIESSKTELQLTTDTISAKVTNLEQSSKTSIDSLTSTVDNISKEVGLMLTETDVSIAISSAMSNGVDKVITSTKNYTFDDEGLSISSSDNNISTIITEDGMVISRNNEAVLTASNEGVKAEDLHATTYLLIGSTSRLEDFGNKTACFWVGEEGE